MMRLERHPIAALKEKSNLSTSQWLSDLLAGVRMMKLDFISIDKLVTAKSNMRSVKEPDVSDILPSVRMRGIIQSILVRPLKGSDLYEVVAGNRRRHAAFLIAQERLANGDAEPMLLPAGISEEGDDAAAIEASLIENLARLDSDEVSQWEAFVRLVKEGRRVEDISATFAIPELRVKRILALGNLLPRIRTLYRNEAVDVLTVRHLTLASKSQQREWLALFDDPQAQAPRGANIKSWLFGGQSIPIKYALFDMASYKGQIVADLFGEEGYFADSSQFWTAQNAAVAARRDAYVAEGWSEVVIMEPGVWFYSWEHRKIPKRKGGRVYIEVRSSGEVCLNEGYLTIKEADRLDKWAPRDAETTTRSTEISGPLTTYIHLHRHAAARAALMAAPQTALRLMVAHAIVRSPLWGLRIEPQATQNEATKESVNRSPGEFLFEERRREMLGLLGLSPDEPALIGAGAAMGPLFEKLTNLPDEQIMRLIPLIMGETLSVGSPAVELIGLTLRIDMADWWEADDAFFRLVRDRGLLLALVNEVARPLIAQANRNEGTKVLKQIVRDYLEGTDGRLRYDRWVPRWMRFPPSAYIDGSSVATVNAHAQAIAREESQSDEPEAQTKEEGRNMGEGALCQILSQEEQFTA